MPGNIIPEVVEVPLPTEARTRLEKPLEYSGSLDSYQNSDLTPVIGREYYGLQVAEIIAAENSDVLVRDLAATSQSCFSLSSIAEQALIMMQSLNVV